MCPLVLEQTTMDQIHRILVNLLRESEAKCAVLVDQDGQCITRKGFTQNIDIEALAALVAGSFASTRAIAKLVGENEFTVLFHQGEKDSIHNVLIDDDTILCVIFDDRTTIGMVRLYSKQAAEQIGKSLIEQRLAVAAQVVDESSDNGNGINLGQAAADKLDDLFGEG